MNSEKYFPAVVVAAYNRVNSLQRLLLSLEQAEYPETAVALVISIDKGDNPDVVKIAEQFQWTHGEKRIIRQDAHLGLKQHILRCGDLTGEFGSIVLFEDDLFASKYFYGFAGKCLNFYSDDNRIAGISLYSYDVSENGFNPFAPVDDGADVYFMQVASSWGQAWTAAQWKNFRAWYANNPEMSKEESLPAYLFNWNENSWKKHFIRYLHRSNKFFVFPRHSFTTNFEEPGATASTKGLFQVSIAGGGHPLEFLKLDESKSVYDAGFEMRAECLKKWCPFLEKFDFTVDLYGTLPLSNCKTPYLLTTKEAKESVLSFALEMFPPVLNVINDLRGNQIRLAKKENVLSENVAADTSYYKYKPVSEIIFQDELVQRVEKVYANYSGKIEELHKNYTEKLEGLHAGIRKLHDEHHQRISELHEDYAVKIKSSVDAALRDYQFKLDYPQFAIVTLVKKENVESALSTLKSVQQQDYSRISHKVIVIGKDDGFAPSEMKDHPNTSFQLVNEIADAIQAAEAHFNHAESDYHCWLEAGAILLPKALLTVRDIFRRFAEVNWLKGLPVSTGKNGEAISFSNGIDFRWDKNRFYSSSLVEISNRISGSGVFWKKHLWQKAGGSWSQSCLHTSDVELYSRMFSIDQLHIVMSYLASSGANYVPSENAKREFSALQKSFPKSRSVQSIISAVSYPFFKKDIPILRAIHKSRGSYPPLIRFDYQSQSFYFSEY